ncbi:MAG: DUF1385 domain-containing protein [Anaerolineales bacterium]
MMRGRNTCAVAVRAPDQSIELEEFELGGLYRSRWGSLPLIRGLVILWDALGLGMRALTYSANVQTGEDEVLEGPALWLTVGTSLLLAIGFFFLVPTGVSLIAERFISLSTLAASLLEGAVRLLLLIGYIWGIGHLPDIRRVYGYHGAEHKTINAFEAGAPLTVSGIRPQAREHPRCGTAFLLTVVLLSILLFAAIGPLSVVARLLSRLALIPILAAVSYEYLRFTANHSDALWARPLIAPNLWIQRLTTREPSDDMIEVAIRSFEAMRAKDSEEANEETVSSLAA